MKKQLFALLNLFTGLNGWAQPSSQILLLEDYVVHEDITYRIPDSSVTNRFTEQDWVMLSPSAEVRREHREIDPEGHEVYRIAITQSSQAQPWEHYPLTIVTDLDGIMLYKPDGDILDVMPHSRRYRLSQDSLAWLRREKGIPMKTKLPELHELDDLMLEDAGASITGDRDAFQISNGNFELEVNNKELFILKRLNSREPGEVFYEYTSFLRTDQGFLIPQYTKTRMMITTHGGFCVEQVHTTKFSEVQHYVSPDHAISSWEEDECPFILYPNPLVDILNISTHKNSVNAHPWQMTVFNGTSESVWEHSFVPTESPLPIDLSFLAAGLYTVRLNQGSQVFTFKLFKI